MTIWATSVEEHRQTLTYLGELKPEFDRAVEICSDAIRTGGKLLFFGNGGSAAMAQHLAAECVVKMGKMRKPIPAIALTADTAVLTATANDLGADEIFRRSIEALGFDGDVAIAFSTSGLSPNVLIAADEARMRGLKTIGMTGVYGRGLASMCNVCLQVPSEDTARIQEVHLLLGHMLVQSIEEKLGLLEDAS